jgi:hypothetical protein
MTKPILAALEGHEPTSYDYAISDLTEITFRLVGEHLKHSSEDTIRANALELADQVLAEMHPALRDYLLRGNPNLRASVARMIGG